MLATNTTSCLAKDRLRFVLNQDRPLFSRDNRVGVDRQPDVVFQVVWYAMHQRLILKSGACVDMRATRTLQQQLNVANGFTGVAQDRSLIQSSAEQGYAVACMQTSGKLAGWLGTLVTDASNSVEYGSHQHASYSMCVYLCKLREQGRELGGAGGEPGHGCELVEGGL